MLYSLSYEVNILVTGDFMFKYDNSHWMVLKKYVNLKLWSKILKISMKLFFLLVKLHPSTLQL